MNPAFLALIGLVVMLLLIFLGMPIGFAMLISGFAGLIYFLGLSTACTQSVITFYGLISNYTMTVLPFFILMGGLASTSGLSTELFRVAEKWLRGLPGGLALATIAGCAGFSSICGSSVATAATMGTVSFPEMKRHGYADRFAAGSIAAGGTLGFLIPPSAAFIIYAIITEQSPGKLLIGGLLPGIMLALAFMAVALIWAITNPKISPTSHEFISWKERLISLRSIWFVLLIFALVIGGMYFGLFTATEAGAIGSFALFVFAMTRRKLRLSNFIRTFNETILTSCMIFMVVFGAYMFNDFIALSGVPALMIGAINKLAVAPIVILLLVLLLFLVLGCFIESIPMMILLVPFTLPIIEKIGYDPLWFGIVSILLVEAALITPPVGMNVLVISSIAKGVPIGQIYRGALPFLIAVVLIILVLIPFPQMATFLPNTMMGK